MDPIEFGDEHPDDAYAEGDEPVTEEQIVAAAEHLEGVSGVGDAILALYDMYGDEVVVI